MGAGSLAFRPHCLPGIGLRKVFNDRERLPNGETADAVYLLLNDPYLDVLNHAPVRPLDYDYLKILTPTAQRFYEIISYRIFAALKYRHPHAKLLYSD